jgi:hypothetical protein
MRSASLLFTAVLSLLVTIFAANVSVQAADDDADEYDVKARVIRISLIKGEVNERGLTFRLSKVTRWRPIANRVLSCRSIPAILSESRQTPF